MRFRIGQRQSRTPGAAENDPALDAELLPQSFDVLDQQRRGVFARLAERPRTAGPALVENDDPVVARIEEATVSRVGAGARPAMEEHNRHTGGLADLLPIYLVQGSNRQHARLVRLNFRV